ncbi:MAG: hypothetical protein Q8K74_04280 [Candidatus Nitrotoga sp.]|nr:hypothetical protein [Candidatus Nitrotoga sp.]MDO9446729.1 hypothetical protein [Candidatus Nitrotoga sp.]MDP1638453.1 hypothetical protein [Candidatus Nitrotoga sp.]MDP1855257.1 hypothetical protein [Candidatus Nitrotoga sp.]MDP3497255.1 hypothetical protein [Candidatus Nitrotoga sp.]
MATKKINPIADKATATFCRGIASGLGIAGALLLLILGGLGWVNIVSAVFLIGISTAVGEWGVRRHRALLKLAVAQELGNVKARFDIELANVDASGLEDVCTEVVPIWSKQVETTRNQTETAIMSLREAHHSRNDKLEQVRSLYLI